MVSGQQPDWEVFDDSEDYCPECDAELDDEGVCWFCDDEEDDWDDEDWDDDA